MAGRKVKIPMVGTVNKTVFIDPNATLGATLGMDLFTPDGEVGTPNTVRAWLGLAVLPPSNVADDSSAGAVHHRLLQGLRVGDDHPQYTRRDILTADGDLYIRAGSVISRLPVGTIDSALRVVNGLPAWRELGRDYIEIYDDFTWLKLINVTTANNWTAVNTSAAGGTGTLAGLAANADPAHPGVARLRTGTGAASGAAILYSSTAGGGVNMASAFLPGAGEIQIDVVFRLTLGIPVVSTDEAIPFLGLVSDTTGLPKTAIAIAGIFDGSTFKLVGRYRENFAYLSNTSVANGFIPTLDTWYHGRIIIAADGSATQFFINGTSLGSLGTTPDPDVGSAYGGFVPYVSYQRTTTGTDKNLEIDCYRIIQRLSTPRWT